MSIMTILANYRDENVQDYTVSDHKEFKFITTAGHGYLCLGSDNDGYSEAIEIARASNYSYILDGGLVYLEEDCDAPNFLNNYKGDK